MPDMPNAEYGDRDIAEDGLILKTFVGSTVHGIHVGDTDDRDEMGIYVEPPANVIGVDPEAPHYISRTKPEYQRSGPGDTDLVMYSLRKYFYLLLKGHPTTLLPLFVPSDFVIAETHMGRQLRDLKPFVLSRQTVYRALKYSEDQQTRLRGGGKRNRVPNRPELVERYGYDTKYAGHALRLAYQAREMALMGSLSLPMPSAERTHVVMVREGRVSLQDVLNSIEGLRRTTAWIMEGNGPRCPLPDEPPRALFNAWSIATHLSYWDIYYRKELRGG